MEDARILLLPAYSYVLIAEMASVVKAKTDATAPPIALANRHY